MARRLDYGQLARDLQRHLAIEGPAKGSGIARALGISQQTFSRLARREASDLLVVGRARATRYAGRRVVPDVGRVVSVFEVDERGGSRRSGTLHATSDGGFYRESASSG